MLSVFFAVQTVCMGTRCWAVGSLSAPRTPWRGCWTTAVRPVGTSLCPPQPLVPTAPHCQVRGIQFMTPWNSCHNFITWSELQDIVRKFIAWLKWFSELLFVVSVGYSSCGRRWRWPAACRHYHCCLLLLSQKSK